LACYNIKEKEIEKERIARLLVKNSKYRITVINKTLAEHMLADALNCIKIASLLFF
jgi:hypothetical protein